MKKILTVIIILVAVFCLGAAAHAETSGNCGDNGDNVKWTLNEAEETVTISGTGAIQDFSSFTDAWPWGKNKAKIIIIESGVTRIGDRFFYGDYVNGITKITIAPTVTSIGKFAFYGLSVEERIKIPDALETIGEKAFEKSKATFTATIGSKGAKAISKAGASFHTAGSEMELMYTFEGDTVTDLAFISSGNKEATTITIPEGVTRVEASSLAEHKNLTTVNLPGTLKSIGAYALENCTSLKSIALPSGLTSIEHEAFYGSGLTSITIPSGVKKIERGTFAGCRGLATITLPNGLTTIEEAAFYHCQAMRTISLPATLTSIGRLTLADTGLTSVSLPDSVTNLEEYVFHNNPALIYVSLSPNIKTIPFNAFNQCVKLEEIAIPSGVKTISGEAFSQCTALKKIVIPDSTTGFGDNLFKETPNAVIWCSQGSPADLYARENKIKTQYNGTYTPPTSGGDVAAGKTNTLTSSFDSLAPNASWKEPYATSSDEEIVKVKKFAVDDISSQWVKFTIELEGVSPGAAFVRVWVKTDNGDVKVWQKTVIVSGQQAVYKVTVTVSDKKAGKAEADPASGVKGTLVTLKATANKDYKFKEWKVLSGGVTVTDNQFRIKSSDVKIEAVFEASPGAPGDNPGSATSGGAVLTLNSNNGTATVTGLDGNATSVVIPDTINGYKVTEIAANAFKGKNIKKVKIGKNVKTIGKNAFNNCKNLESVSGGNGIETIGDGAFQKCVKLKAITLGKKVKKIGKNAFNGCKALAKVTVKTALLTKKTLGKSCFKGLPKKVVFKVPKKQKALYKEIFVKTGKAPKTATFK